MKNGMIIILGCLMASNVFAKEFEFNKPLYSASVYQSSTGSGYGNTLNMNLNIQKNQKVFTLGFMLNNHNQHFMGVEFSYRHFLGYHKNNFGFRTIQPYLHYNFLYRSPEEMIINPNAIISDPSNMNLYGGEMTTFEHALGMGLQVRLIRNIYLDGNAGFGIYLGSKYQGMHPNTPGIHHDNWGWVPSFRLGVGYKF